MTKFAIVFTIYPIAGQPLTLKSSPEFIESLDEAWYTEKIEFFRYACFDVCKFI